MEDTRNQPVSAPGISAGWVLAGLLLSGLALSGLACAGSSGGEGSSERDVAAMDETPGDAMKNEDSNKIEAVRAEYEDRLMATPGVVSVGLGLGESGQPCLKIGTTRPVEEVRKLLPEGIFEVPVELELLGEIEAQ